MVVTSGSISGTNSDKSSGTNARISPRAWGMIFGLLVISNTVNITSALFIPAADRHFDMWEIAVWEGSSALILILLPPVFYAAFVRWPLERLGWMRFVAVQTALLLAFSLLHVVGMFGVRKLAYFIAHDSYNFTHGRPLLTFLYELRKDAVTYLIFLSFFWLDQRLRAHPPALSEPQPVASRLELKADGRTVFVDPAEVSLIEAAGNYVELYTPTKIHLVRGVLSTFEAQLRAQGFVRVHRSRLINRAHIRAIEPTPSGDVKITLDDGRTVLGSRRFREGLKV
jgi:hypothetical protein